MLEMINYLEYLNMPTVVGMSIVAIFLFMQIIGEFLEFTGKVVPEVMKIRKYFARKKKEHEVLSQLPMIFEEFRKVPKTLQDVQELLNSVDKHYNTDNIAKRDEWIKTVNYKLGSYDKLVQELNTKLDKNNEDTLELLIENKRNTIINFASYVINEKTPVTREQFNRVFKIYSEYEDIIDKNEKTNGEVDIAFRIIQEAYECHMRNHTFVEDIRGYDIKL